MPRQLNKRTAKRYACAEARAILQGFLDADSNFGLPRLSDTYTQEERDQDLDAIHGAMQDLLVELDRRSGKCTVTR